MELYQYLNFHVIFEFYLCIEAEAKVEYWLCIIIDSSHAIFAMPDVLEQELLPNRSSKDHNSAEGNFRLVLYSKLKDLFSWANINLIIGAT